jgi:protein-L-isoaspartate O-methyltransferase
MQIADVREQMIEQQVRAWDVLDERVLDAMRGVPRELFAPEGERYRAYADAEVPTRSTRKGSGATWNRCPRTRASSSR